jgi:hypothetical protein
MSAPDLRTGATYRVWASHKELPKQRSRSVLISACRDRTSIAMTVPEHFSSNLRRGKSWGVAVAASASICLVCILNRNGCWLYSRGTRWLTVFVFPWVWLLLMFGFRTRGRLVLVVLTLFGRFFWSHVDTVSIVAADSTAVATLRQLRAALDQLTISAAKSGMVG